MTAMCLPGWSFGRQGLAMLVGLWLLAPVAWAQTEIRYQFKKGDVSRQVMTQSISMNMTLPGPTPMVIRNNIHQQMYLETTNEEVLADGSCKQRQAIKRMIVKTASDGVAGAGVEFEFDSDSGETPEGPLAAVMLQTLKPMIGAEWQHTISPQGKVSDIKVPEKVIEAMKNNPGAAMMGNLATAEGLKQLTADASMVFPDKPLSLNDTWDSDISMKMPFGEMITTKTMKYLGPGENGMERFGLSTRLAFKAKEDSPAQLTIADNKSDGEVLFDNRQGKFERSKLHQVTQMRVTVAGQTINQVVTTDVLLEPQEQRARTNR